MVSDYELSQKIQEQIKNIKTKIIDESLVAPNLSNASIEVIPFLCVFMN